MGWYDMFALFYDSAVERLYLEQRGLAADALDVRPESTVLDLPCGTGQSFDVLQPLLGTGGRLIAADLSSGMLKKARARAGKLGAANVEFLVADARSISREQLAEAGAPDGVDRLHVFLGLSAFPDWRATFANLWGLLAPGGRCVVVDVHAETLGFQGRMVNLTARADITRPFWEPLEDVAEGYERRQLPSLPDHGGTMWLATGLKSKA